MDHFSRMPPKRTNAGAGVLTAMAHRVREESLCSRTFDGPGRPLSRAEVRDTVTDAARPLGRSQPVQVTRRDGDGLCSTTARHDGQRKEMADITGRLLAARLTRRLPDEDHGEATAP
jgi:hypothetical protein